MQGEIIDNETVQQFESIFFISELSDITIGLIVYKPQAKGLLITVFFIWEMEREAM